MIEAEALRKQFGTFTAVREMSLHVGAGEVVALLGPNGAGKTTTVRMLAAILRPTSGRARVGGYDVVTHARQVRASVGLLTEFPGLYGRMRAPEYLQFFGDMLGVPATRAARNAEQRLRQFGLWEARDKPLESFSKGMKQKMALIRALIHEPPILFLDEPTTAMDPQSARVVRDAIGELRAQRRTILLTTHNLAEAEVLADRIVVIAGGGIVAQGTIAELTRAWLGDPLWELELAAPAEMAASRLADLVQPEVTTPQHLRYRCAEPRLINPQLAQRLSVAGVPLVAMTEVPRRLEDVYLSIVGQERDGAARVDAVQPEEVVS